MVIISRHPGKVADLVARHARVVEGSIDDHVVLDRTREGADALYWANPGNLRPDYENWSTRAAKRQGDRKPSRRHPPIPRPS